MSEADERRGRLSVRDRSLALAAPLLLLAIAALGVWSFHARRQSSWIGSSFGMFATYDNHATRAIRVTVVRDGDSTRVDPRLEFPDLVERSRVSPGGTAPAELAEQVRRLTGADQAIVEIWTLAVDREDELVVFPERIRRVSAG